MKNNSLYKFILEESINWKPKTKNITYYGYHGSYKDELISETLYFDEYRKEWVNRKRAFQGHLFNMLNKTLQDLI